MKRNKDRDKRDKKSQDRLAVLVRRIMDEMEKNDEYEDKLYGKDNRGDELPEHLRTRKEQLKRIEEAKASLEKEQRAKKDANLKKMKERTEKERKKGGTGKHSGQKNLYTFQ
ncbi:MAG: hypothetical protein QW728_04235 [Thermoplasmata archaeon]